MTAPLIIFIAGGAFGTIFAGIYLFTQTNA